MIPIILTIVVLLSGSIGTVVAADSAKPGDVLFGVDRTAENVRLFLSLTSTQKANVKAKIAEERERERQKLEAEGRTDDAEEAREHADEALENAIETISGVRSKLEDKGNAQAEESLSKVEGRLQTLRDLRDEREDVDGHGLTEAEVKLQNGTATVKLELNDTKTTFTLNTTDQTAIIREIATRTGLTEAEIRDVVKFEVEDDDTNANTNRNTNEDDDKNTNQNSNTNRDDDNEDESQTNVNTNRSVNSNTNTSREEEEDDTSADRTIEIRVEVKREDSKAEIRTKVNGAEREWELYTTNQTTILLDISAKTGLTTAQIEAVWEYKVED